MIFNPEQSEQELVDKIVLSRQLVSVFESFLVPFYLHPEDPLDEAWIYTNLPSRYLGIMQGQPGDIDVLYIPIKSERPQLRNVVAAEVKIIRPTRARPGKDHKDSGRKQVLGMVRHGLPIISLNHVILPDTNKLEQKRYFTSQAEMLNSIGRKLSGIGNERQEGRLSKLELPPFVGWGASLLEEVGNVLWSSVNHSKFCERNINYNIELDSYIIQLVQQLQPLVKLPGRHSRARIL